MAVWVFLEKKYLPKYTPDWAIKIGEENKDYSRTGAMCEKNNPMQEIWSLFKSDKITSSERIVLGSTFDNVLVKVRGISKVLKAFREFGGETSLKEQSDLIEKAIKKNKKIIAIGWNQTSVNGDTWSNEHYDEKLDENKGYNLEKDTRHWFLMDSVFEIEKRPVIR